MPPAEPRPEAEDLPDPEEDEVPEKKVRSCGEPFVSPVSPAQLRLDE